MRKFTLPLGMFQVHMPATVVEAAEPLRRALEDLARVTRESPPWASHRSSMEDDAWIAESERVIEKVKKASDEFQLRLKSTEFPCVLPPRAYDLIYASLVAQAFDLRFEITDYTLERTDENLAYWWVEGQIRDLNGERRVYPGTSFAFNSDDEKQSDGALLSACADAFVDCVFAAVPHFPRAREKERPWVTE